MTDEHNDPTPVDTTEDEPSTVVEPETSDTDDACTPDDSGEKPPEDGDTFPRSYVERLRRESAGYRERANTADTYARRLHTELVRATGRLAEPDRPRVRRGTSRRP